jgi:hypothetical protein
MTYPKAKIDLLLREPPPKQEPAAAAIYTYEATSAEQYLELLQTDPRPWWHEATPRKKPRLKNVKLTNALSSSAATPSKESAAPGEITSRNSSFRLRGETTEHSKQIDT